MPLFRDRDVQKPPAAEGLGPTRKLERTVPGTPTVPTVPTVPVPAAPSEAPPTVLAPSESAPTVPYSPHSPMATRRVERSEPHGRSIVEATPTDVPSVQTSASDPLDDPVVGWLAIVAGMGCGTVLPLGYGVNDIGHGSRVRLPLPSTTTYTTPVVHLAVIYTARTRCFYAQAMDSDIYVNGTLLQASCALQYGDTVQVGGWQLRFVPLCGADFDWKSMAE